MSNNPVDSLKYLESSNLDKKLYNFDQIFIYFFLASPTPEQPKNSSLCWIFLVILTKDNFFDVILFTQR